MKFEAGGLEANGVEVIVEGAADAGVGGDQAAVGGQGPPDDGRGDELPGLAEREMGCLPEPGDVVLDAAGTGDVFDAEEEGGAEEREGGGGGAGFAENLSVDAQIEERGAGERFFAVGAAGPGVDPCDGGGGTEGKIRRKTTPAAGTSCSNVRRSAP